MYHAGTLMTVLGGTVLTSILIGNVWAQDPAKFVYPLAPRGEVVDDYHGTRVADPYRALEDPDSPASRTWIDAENRLTFDFLEKIPARKPLQKRLEALWNYERFSVPFKRGARYFYSRNSGLQNQAVLLTADALDAAPRVLLDPNTLSADGTVALSGLSISDDGNKLAYALAEAGSDWTTWKVRNVATGEDTSDLIRYTKNTGAAWTKDGAGFYYARYPEPKPGQDLREANFYQKLYYHRLGTAQVDDKLIYERTAEADKDWVYGSGVTDDGKFLVIAISRGTDDRNRVLYQELDKPGSSIVELIGNFEAGYDLIDNDGSVLFFKTNKDAPRGRIVAIDVRDPAQAKWREIVPQVAETLQSASLVGDRFFADYLHDAHSQIKLFDIAGKPLGEVQLPGLGTAGGFRGEWKDTETFYSFTSYATPATIFRYEVATGKSSIYKAPKLLFNPNDFTTEQVFFSSKDGTRIPMFLTYKKGLKKDASAPTYLYGYGGFNISQTPGYSPRNLAWMELGGVFAVVNLRGGGEYGEDWHKAGTKLVKQNVFDDFIGAAEWLIRERYTQSAKLAIGGGSNGGLLVGACMTQRPELFGAALPAVGVMDMLRFHRFTVGHFWVDDYGSADNASEFAAIYKYSPLHNIKPGTCYPATLITTADHDDRVVPAHSFKFAATLQAAQACHKPTLIRIETKAGHGAGKPTSKIIEEAADCWAFLVQVLNIEWKE